MSPAARFGAYWLGFTVLFIALQLVIADERPDWFGVAVLIVAALPVAFVLTLMERRDG
ncbi:MAG: hypothetical protein ACRDLS_12830 [Solirubrobacteraceae bacterium]